ncbi:uncharacterized protein LOC115621286 [Scaptodrosophila lebanonensis]|uniref:Uncharacterized protein LOC115621286 n=1 Tax=Drosophila lebanonensis TaxID=7225 RepID=A0A6J2T422_DROLE|nr:uncharacterized protein LOC115621286 [Scaptodrosophila lebanonensis]
MLECGPSNELSAKDNASKMCTDLSAVMDTTTNTTIITEKNRQHRKRRQGTTFDGSANWRNRLLLMASGVLLMLLASLELVEGALRNVNLIIEPPAVRRGQHAVLRCMYDLKGAPLYSAKFYRGQLEFYRYTPGEFPNTKVFPFPGIHVDVTSSNATQVLIRNVGFGLSGNFSCEVTADAPLFSTATAVGQMQVVELPDKRPQLYTEHTRYEPGDVLRANCSTPPSRPRAELKFTINNMVVTNAETQYIRTIDNLIASRISLKLQLQGVHFSSANAPVYNGYGLNSVYGGHGGPMYAPNPGGLVLRCTAQIGELYQEYKEIELGTPQKDPVPARVTLSSGSSMKNFFSTYFSTSAASRRFGIGYHLAPVAMAVAALLVSGGSLLTHMGQLIMLGADIVDVAASADSLAVARIVYSNGQRNRSDSSLKAPVEPRQQLPISQR